MVVSRFVLGAGLSVSLGVASAASAVPVNIMALGDSITAGVGSSDSQFRDNGGGNWSSRGGSSYRKSLNNYLADYGSLPEWNFVGTRTVPNPVTTDRPTYTGGPITNNWNRTFGLPGIEADATNNSLRSAVAGYDSAANGMADIITLHIGSNSSGSDMTTSPANYTSSSSADAQLHRLLDTIRTDSDFSGTDKILVARIIPKDNGSVSDLQNVINYNYSSTEGINGAVAALPDVFEDKVEIVDLFKIAISDQMLSFLAQQVGELVADVENKIDPMGTGYVDWLAGLNEATHAITGTIARNANLYTDITGFDGTNYVYGTSDGTHPSDLGYAVMGWAWGQAIPEPATLALLVLGGAFAASRRGRLA